MDEDKTNGTATPEGVADNAEKGIDILTSEKVAEITNARRQKKGRKKLRISKQHIIIALLLLAIIGLIVFAIISSHKNKSLKNGDVLAVKEYALSSKADFYTYQDKIYFATNDSLRLIDRKGKDIWVDSYTMMSPVMSGDKNIVAIAEKNGSNVRVYNEKGMLYNIAFNEPIITYAVNGTGCLGAITKKESDYELSVYDSDGTKIYGGSYIAKDGIPMAMDISDDGSMFAVSFMNVSNIKMQCNVLFYYIDNSEMKSAEESNGMFTSVVCDDCMPFMLKFTPDNRCVSLMDDRLMFISPSSSGTTEQTEVKIGNAVKYACLNNNGTIAVAFGDAQLNVAEQVPKNTVQWYSSKGEKVNEYTAQKDITGLFAGDNATVIATGRGFEAYKSSGGSLWQYTAIQDTTKVLTYNGNDKMIAVTPVKMVIAKVGKGNNVIESAEENTEDVTEQTTKAAEKTSEKASENTSEKAAEKASEKTTEKAAEKATEKAAQKATQKAQ